MTDDRDREKLMSKAPTPGRTETAAFSAGPASPMLPEIVREEPLFLDEPLDQPVKVPPSDDSSVWELFADENDPETWQQNIERPIDAAADGQREGENELESAGEAPASAEMTIKPFTLTGLVLLAAALGFVAVRVWQQAGS